jgi:cytoskeletal protein CcmA (bactofilin family)
MEVIMFKKWGTDTEKNINEDQETVERMEQPVAAVTADIGKVNSVNTILRGSKLSGDINVTCDLELSGDVEGNITSLQDSSIIIKGTCKGNIETKGGSVVIEGKLSEGNITAGRDVTISGKFDGGEVTAKGKVYINGEFNGKLEGSEVKIGAKAEGKGEILYSENISIERGAKIEVQINRARKELKLVKNTPDNKSVEVKIEEKAAAAGVK